MDIALPVHLTEPEFIRACVRKERWAQQLLYEEYYSPMMAICLRYSNNQDDALDLLHEGFIKVFKHISKYEAGTSLSAWIRRIMVNTCIDHYRKVVRRRTEDIGEAYQLYSMDPDAVSNCTTREILDAVQSLSPAYRTVFNLYVIDGYAHREIAELLNITESTSRSNLVKARLKLQEILKDRGAYEE
jgi:RNA polymerase sigma-70 factor (ECF subfamily)